MQEEEDVASYFLRVDDNVNSIRGLGATNKENSVVQKIMRNLPAWFNLKVSILENINDLDNMAKDELYGIITTYEMKTKPENVFMKESMINSTTTSKSTKTECNNIAHM